jgi:hypothetical protein
MSYGVKVIYGELLANLEQLAPTTSIAGLDGLGRR